MSLSADAYEQLGAFYLGREYDPQTGQVESEPLLYDSKDLVTHGVVLGMTGSGKTGLCIALLEEAAMDSIPAIVIDPKGDIPNLLLTFPGLQASDFRPWINEDDARKKGVAPEAYAESQAALWTKGLAEWGQSGERIGRMREKVEILVYTPGSSAGIPVSILGSLEAPGDAIREDPEALGDRVESAVSSLLGLMGVTADPIQSREHILLSRVFLDAWRQGDDLTLPDLIRTIQHPPFNAVGVVPLESFMKEEERFALAMQLNHLLASPGFQSWTQGAPLDVARLLHDDSGKPRISILSIAHLEESERMFFVSLLLNEIVSWMRSQSGTSSLRALLYMDEIFGYLPPVANPPSKKPLMTLLKQARAFGLGLLLATQNPVDLDYKALSNIGSWFLGRLQTEGDKARVLEGLEGAAAAGREERLSRSEMEALLAGLASRVFLLNNVHEDGPVTFQVRWVMSYLRGPLSRVQIKALMDPVKESMTGSLVETGSTDVSSAPPEQTVIYQLSRKIDQVYLPLERLPGESRVIYRPAILGVAEIDFNDAKRGVRATRVLSALCLIDEKSRHIDFSAGQRAESAPRRFDDEGVEGGALATLPDFARESSWYTEQKKAFVDWIYREYRLEVFACPELGAFSGPGETEADFRLRLQQGAREKRDASLEALRDKYAKVVEAKEKRLAAAERRLDREEAQASSAKVNTFISIGSTLLSALLGRKRVSVSTVSRGTTAARGVSRSMKESREVEAAGDEVRKIREELAALDSELEREMEEVRQALDPLSIPLVKERLEPYKKDIVVKRMALAWLPCLRVSEFDIEPAWSLDRSGAARTGKT